jgi:hypothetical protein|tara:strand:- start:1611 stop:2054 length:444 start_codon:yes stop_codon:yes gene_type:complete
MITLKELQDMWQEDCKVDELNLGQESTRIPELHSKYLNHLSTLRLQCRRSQSELFKMRRLKWKYYRGELDQKELNERGWDQYLGNAPLNNQMNEFLDTDEDVIKLTDKLEYLNTCLTLCESVMKSISSRSFDIKNAIEWTKFTNGSY